MKRFLPTIAVARRAVVLALLLSLASLSLPTAAGATVTVSGFSPTSGGAGTPVTITGTGFASTNKVTIGGAAAPITSATSTQLVVTVPAGARTGAVAVTDANGTATASGTFTVTPGICCTRTVTPASSFPLYGTAFAPFALVTVELRDHGDRVAGLASPTTDGTGGFTIASLVLPLDVGPGNYDLVATQGEKAASFLLSVRANWAAPGATARNKGEQPFETALSPYTIEKIDVDWTAAATDGSSRPVVAGGYVLSRQGGDLVALNASTGSVAWRKTVGGYSSYPPTVVGSTVYASAGTAGVKAVSLTTGNPLWTSSCPSCAAGTNYYNLAVADGLVVVATGDRLRAFSASNGTWVWTSGATVRAGSYTAGITIVNGAVLTNIYGAVVAFDVNTGAKLWENPSSATYWTTDYQTVPVVNGVAFYSDSAARPTAVRVSNGAVIWTRADITSYDGSSAIGKGVILVGTSANLQALHVTDGTTRWTLARRCQNSTYANDLFYVGCEDQAIRVLDSYGSVRQVLGTHGSSYLAPVIANGTLFAPVGYPQYRLYAFNVAGGLK